MLTVQSQMLPSFDPRAKHNSHAKDTDILIDSNAKLRDTLDSCKIRRCIERQEQEEATHNWILLSGKQAADVRGPTTRGQVNLGEMPSPNGLASTTPALNESNHVVNLQPILPAPVALAPRRGVRRRRRSVDAVLGECLASLNRLSRVKRY